MSLQYNWQSKIRLLWGTPITAGALPLKPSELVKVSCCGNGHAVSFTLRILSKLCACIFNCRLLGFFTSAIA